MKQFALIVFLVLMVAFAFYFLGKKNGSSDLTTDIVNNTTLIKQIAELSALEVNGISNIKVSNKGDNKGLWDKFKNYLAENTLYIAIPYQAKYGVDMKNLQININTIDSIVNIDFPSCKLLSLQLQLDKINAIGQTGVFNTIALEQYINVQKQLYEASYTELNNNKRNQQMAEENIKAILLKYYAPMHLKVSCNFGKQKAELNK